MTTFLEMGLSDPVTRAITELGYEEPTPIQQQAIPALMAGGDVIGQAQTGTGKTAAFGIPIIERCPSGGDHPTALVLAPTRELAIQDAEAIHVLGRFKSIRVAPIYGGQPIERQLRLLRHGTDVVVGTPGRIMDHLRRGTLSLEHIKMVVLDEADIMLDMGFVEDMEYILDLMPAERQTALFSATMSPRISALARKYLRDPKQLSVSHEKLTVTEIRQVCYEVLGPHKLDALTRILDMEMPSSAIIFARTKRDAGELADQLAGLGYVAEPIHGDLSQMDRDRVMRRFRDGVVELLVATDVAARGLDIPDVSHVINFDVPTDPEAYVHRIGRTGRAGKKGEAITLVTPRERGALRLIERLTSVRLKIGKLPTAADVAERRRSALKETLRATIRDTDLQPYLLVVEELAEDYDVAEIAAAALKLSGDLEVKRGESFDRNLAPADQMPEDGQKAEPGMVKLFLNIGRADGLRPTNLVGALANEAKIPPRIIGAIDIYDTFTFVQVPKAAVNQVVQALQRTNLMGRRINVDVARPRTARR